LIAGARLSTEVTLAPRAIVILEKALDAIGRALDGQSVMTNRGDQGRHATAAAQAKALRELANVAGLWRGGAAQDQKRRRPSRQASKWRPRPKRR